MNIEVVVPGASSELRKIEGIVALNPVATNAGVGKIRILLVADDSLGDGAAGAEGC